MLPPPWRPRRGNEVDIPTLREYELWVSTDTGNGWWGTPGGNVQLWAGGGGSVYMDPKKSTTSASAVAAGASSTLNSDQISSGKTGQLVGIHVSGSVPFKATLCTVANGVANTVFETGFGWEGHWHYEAPDKTFTTIAEDVAAGLDGFRVVVTNLDPALAADFYVTFYWDEV